jgi:hypothetical protein
MRMKTTRIFLAILGIFLLLSACGRTPVQPGGIMTSSESPPSTRLPTQTSTPSPTVDTGYPTWNAERTATEQARETVVAQFPGNCGAAYAIMSVSPDGNWMASNCFDQKKFIVLSRDGSKQWLITYQEILRLYKGTSLDYIYIDSIDPYHWSADSRYIYFFIYLQPQPSFGSPYVDFEMDLTSRPIYRLDITNGIWTEFTPPANYLSFSPTDRRLVTIYANIAGCLNDPCPVEISVLDLKTGDKATYTLNNTLAAGYVIWTEDGTMFFFISIGNSPSIKWAFDYTIFMVDTGSKALVRLKDINGLIDLVYPVKLTSGNKLEIRIQTYDEQPNIDDQYLDLTTNQMVSPTLTPKP